MRALRLDGAGGATAVPADAEGAEDAGAIWVRLDYAQPEAAEWVRAAAGIPPFAAEILLMEETRPRLVVDGEHLALILRGVNLNPGQDPEDMVSVRIWCDGRRLVSARHRALMAERDQIAALETGTGARDCGQLVAGLAARMAHRMAPTIESLQERIDDLEMNVLERNTTDIHGELADIRRTAIVLRRYLAPQSEVLAELQEEPLPWLKARHRTSLHHAADHTLRYVEDLAAVRERTAVTQEEVNSRLTTDMNRSIFRLTVLATIVLPLTLVAGLLGMNVAGIPGAESPAAFGVVVGLMAALAGGTILVLRWMKWL